MVNLATIDLFCGAGGLTHGLVREGVPVVAGVDIEDSCQFAYENNNGAFFLHKDVVRVKPGELRELFGQVDIRMLAGCAPCQPFSTYAQRYDTVGTPKWALLYEFRRLIKGVDPELVTMENVPTVSKHQVYHDFVESLKKSGYHVWQDVVDCSRYGLPQRRKRMVLLASRLGPVSLIEPTHAAPATVRQAIGHLPRIAAGASSRSDPLHMAAGLSPINLDRIRASKPGGSWRDWPAHLVAECHQRDSGQTYPGVYGRMAWDEPSPTLTTQYYGFGSGRFGHPAQDRAISLREGAILQGFPGDYAFVQDDEPIHLKTLGRMIGNAVPVTLGEIIGRSIRRHLGETVGSTQIAPLGMVGTGGGDHGLERLPLVA
ncbi:DNA cytosine methyltransferase [Ramlibacter sp. MAHUQ-53]|uniref:DNA cytosine methyltransferase n=1 Tax=unclassified Ramlibacter TaxID=2617605 RepID=UPI00362E1422